MRTIIPGYRIDQIIAELDAYQARMPATARDVVRDVFGQLKEYDATQTGFIVSDPQTTAVLTDGTQLALTVNNLSLIHI